MAIITAANFDYKGPLANFERDSYATLSEMVSVNENYLPNVFIGVCFETGKAYLYNKSNTINPTLGKWREITGGTDAADFIRKTKSFDGFKPEYNGEIIQYIGTTTQDYTNGYFYKAVAQGTDPESYNYEQIDVQPATDLVWGNIEGNVSDQADLQDILNTKASVDSLNEHIQDTNNPHQVTKEQTKALINHSNPLIDCDSPLLQKMLLQMQICQINFLI